jgi:CheY-like chemotaxis protein
MGKSILLADDSATIRKVVELTFSDSDFHVRSVASGAEALEVLELHPPDVVLADVVMPEPTGYEICRRVKSSDRPVPVLLLAGTFEAFDHDEARACGADGCLLKPFDPKTLVDRVASLLAERDAIADAGVEPVDDDAVEIEGELLDRPAAPVEEPASGDAVPTEARLDPPVLRDAQVAAGGIDSRIVDAVVEAVVTRLSDEVVREIAREVVPRVAESVVRERIRELEREER